jgi:hypothetical protein
MEEKKMSQNMDSIEKLLKTGRPAPQPEHNFQIIFQEEPKLIDVAQLERDAKEYQKRTGEADTSEIK